MIRRAQDFIEVWRQTDNELEITPRQIATLCLFWDKGVCSIKEVDKRYWKKQQLSQKNPLISNAVNRLHKAGYLLKPKTGKFILSRKGLDLIIRLFPHTYINETNAS